MGIVKEFQGFSEIFWDFQGFSAISRDFEGFSGTFGNFGNFFYFLIGFNAIVTIFELVLTLVKIHHVVTLGLQAYEQMAKNRPHSSLDYFANCFHHFICKVCHL